MVFVTGATGLLGSHLLYYLARSGKEVYALKRKDSRIEAVREVWQLYTSDDTLWEMGSRRCDGPGGIGSDGKSC